MGNYYYLIAGLPDLTLEDHKLNFTTATFKEELYSQLTAKDKRLIDLFYLKFDNANLLKLLNNKEAQIDERGNFTSDELLRIITEVKNDNRVEKKECPEYIITFLHEYFSNEAPNNGYEQENQLTTLYYSHAMRCRNKFVAAWFSFNLTVNNILLALIARKYKLEIANNLIGQGEVVESLSTSGAKDFGLTIELPFFDDLQKIADVEDLLEREKRIDQLKWKWIEEHTFFNYFSVEKLFAFLLMIEMVERWLALDKERGRELFRDIVDTLKNEMSIPAEFK